MSHKKHIPQALREQVWITHFGKTFEHKCYINWCKNMLTVFDFESGHDQPESKGGKTSIENLYPVCGRCNKSMSNHYTIQEWQKFGIQEEGKEVKEEGKIHFDEEKTTVCCFKW